MNEIKIKNGNNNKKGDILKGFLKSEDEAIEVNEVYLLKLILLKLRLGKGIKL